MAIFKNIAGHLLDWAGVANVPAALTALASLKGKPGQIVQIGGVDAQGGVTELVAVDKPEGGDNSGQNAELTAEQEAALEGLLGVTAFIKPDVSAEIAAFRAAFGLDGGDDPDEPVDPEEPEQPGGDDGFDSGLIDLTAQTVVDYGDATHQVVNKHTMVVTRPSASGYSYIIVNGLTPGATYDLYIQPYEGSGNASVYANKTLDATDDSGYGRSIQTNTSIADKYSPLHFTLNDGEYGILIYCYGSVTGLRLVAAEG